MPRSKAAQKHVVYWRDIPAQVICKAGRTTAKRELDKRFITDQRTGEKSRSRWRI